MKAVKVREPGGPDMLELVDLPVPKPAAEEVLVKVHAAGLNRGDVVQRLGKYPPPPGSPDTLGLEVAGEVVAVGDRVERWRPGDRVCGLMGGGGYAEYAVIHQHSTLPLPAALSMVEGAGLVETAMTVWTNVFDQCDLKPGERFLVHGGASGIGTMAIEIAAALGSEVYATASGEERCRRCEELGAKRAIDYRKEDFVKVIREATDGKGVDVILDMVGGDYVERNMEVAAMRGRIVWIAFLQGSKVNIDLRPLMMKRLGLFGSTLRARSADEKARIASDVERVVWPLIEEGKVRPVIDSVFPLARAGEAQAHLEKGGHVGKIVLEVVAAE